MEAVRKLERQFVITWRQVQNRFRISFPEVPVSIVRWNHLSRRYEIRVDQNMVMSCAFDDLACRLDFHSLHNHDYLHGPFDLCTVFWFQKEYFTLGRLFLPTSKD
jgi:hypothetical protein